MVCREMFCKKCLQILLWKYLIFCKFCFKLVDPKCVTRRPIYVHLKPCLPLFMLKKSVRYIFLNTSDGLMKHFYILICLTTEVYINSSTFKYFQNVQIIGGFLKTMNAIPIYKINSSNGSFFSSISFCFEIVYARTVWLFICVFVVTTTRNYRCEEYLFHVLKSLM